MREGIFAVGLLEISFTGVSWSLLYKAKAPATPSFKRVSLFSSTLTSAVKNNIILFPLKYRNIALAKQTCEDFIEFARWSMADKIRGYADLQGSRGAQLIINLAIFTIQQRWNQPWLVANNVSRNRKKTGPRLEAPPTCQNGLGSIAVFSLQLVFSWHVAKPIKIRNTILK